MKELVSSSTCYQVGGALGKDFPAYVTRAADRQFYEALQGQEFCYVLNSRQMGKSSLMVRTLAKLQSDGWVGIVLDFSAKDSQENAQPDRWYNGIINQLNRHFCLLDNARSWLKERDFLSPVERLEEFIKMVLLPGINQPIVIFIDEIDSTLNLSFTDDFFALIRACYNRRAENSEYQRLTFALLGVAAPAELIGDKKRTPFNIGRAIDLKGFELGEAQPLVGGLVGKADNPQAVLSEILNWTGGQPFLTQRLCQLVINFPFPIPAEQEAQVVEQLTQSRIIENWESQDEQEHLKTIRNRILSDEQKAGYLLELYRQIRQAGKLKSQNTSEERDLQLSGLVVKRDDQLTVYNPIYEQVFDEPWIDAELGKLRPYAENFRAWLASGKTDTSRLLRGEALVQAERWAEEKNLSGEDRDFLAACRTRLREEEIAAKEREAELERERKGKEAAEEAKKVAEEAQQILAKAKEDAEKANEEGKQRLRRRTLIGTIILGVALLGAVVFAVEASKQANETKKQVDIAGQAKTEAQEAGKKVKEANQQISTAKEEAAKKLKEAQKAKEDAKIANWQAQQAKQDAKNAQQNLAHTQQAKEKLQQRAQQLKQAAQQAATKAAQAEIEVQTATNALKTVRSLSQLAGGLRKKGEVDAADQALRKAGLSTLIENEELKQAWLFAATAEAEAKDKPKEAQATVKLSLNSLKNSKAQVNQGIFNQVSAFVHFMDGQLNNDNEQDYRAAYNALKASKFDPYNPKTETDILTEKDVELIPYKLIKSGNIDINSEKDPIAISFRQHLYNGLEFLLNEDRLQEADQKTTEIMLYIAQRKEEGRFRVEDIENFSCSALQMLDKLWYDYPNFLKHFGFHVQKEIWKKVGSPTPNSPIMHWKKFYNEVGWKDANLKYNELEGFRNVETSPQGNLPTGISPPPEISPQQSSLYPTNAYLIPRIANCNL